MNGLEGVAFYKHFVEGKRVQLVTSPEVRAVIWDQRLKASMSALWNGQQFRQLGFDDYFDHLPLSWTDDTASGPFRIRARRTLPPRPHQRAARRGRRPHARLLQRHRLRPRADRLSRARRPHHPRDQLRARPHPLRRRWPRCPPSSARGCA